MKEQTLFYGLILGWFVLAVMVFIALFFFVAPYGRHVRQGWGPTVDNKKGWIIMEAAAPVVFFLCFLSGSNPNTVTTLLLLGMWEAHYVHRAFIYPLGLKGTGKRMPVVVMSSALIFNAVNGYLNGRYIFTFSGGYPDTWLWDARFITGLALFIAGYIINRSADSTLGNLRKAGESDYRIARGGFYRWISCPNYFGEVITWIGWAVATWSLAGLAFAFWTVVNLAPRARAHHLWYRERFADYPPERKALVPGLW